MLLFSKCLELENIQLSPEADFDSIYSKENFKQSGFFLWLFEINV